MNKIKVKDKVVILAGKDKGKVGIVSKVLKKTFIDIWLNKEILWDNQKVLLCDTM